MNSPMNASRVGDGTITRIPELLLESFGPSDLIPEWQPGILDRSLDRMVPICLNETRDRVVISTHAWLVQTPHLTVIVEAAVGNGKPRAMKAFDNSTSPS